MLSLTALTLTTIHNCELHDILSEATALQTTVKVTIKLTKDNILRSSSFSKVWYFAFHSIMVPIYLCCNIRSVVEAEAKTITLVVTGVLIPGTTKKYIGLRSAATL